MEGAEEGAPNSRGQSSAGRRRNMQAISRKDTKPELAVRSLLHASGLRYRCDLRLVIGGRAVRPDIVFTRRKVAVFIDGCFWHSCPEHGTKPRTNIEYWGPKLERNRARDVRDTATLEEAGWLVVRAWEHTPPEEIAAAVQESVLART
ncbi:very short patch repair endonuclease [Microbacterium sp.]|uniref:very short patch repair endonuclease n=1 Tax=Microbacterium sp. TaxID=51671 RepID=UPI003C1BB768